GTVHRFQGGEKRIVLFSHVIAKGEPRFLNSRVNLLNVAVSRAQKHFIFIGSLEALSRGTYTSLLKKHLIQEGEAIKGYFKN
ncbi:MAG: ATP-binding domain-containing protein, partial [bacterium]|nr:ATP-binding domain-containing protein [bacterium]